MSSRDRLTLYVFIVGAVLACLLGVMYAPLPH